jgi:predicted RND superfamily exporter protein
MASRFAKMTQTIIFIIFAVVLSIILLSYFNINMTSNEPSKLNRFAVYEGYEEHRKSMENLDNRANLIIQ